MTTYFYHDYKTGLVHLDPGSLVEYDSDWHDAEFDNFDDDRSEYYAFLVWEEEFDSFAFVVTRSQMEEFPVLVEAFEEWETFIMSYRDEKENFYVC